MWGFQLQPNSVRDERRRNLKNCDKMDEDERLPWVNFTTFLLKEWAQGCLSKFHRSSTYIYDSRCWFYIYDSMYWFYALVTILIIQHFLQLLPWCAFGCYDTLQYISGLLLIISVWTFWMCCIFCIFFVYIFTFTSRKLKQI